jgi:hypothetical protein
MIRIPVTEIIIDDTGTTLWVNAPAGTVLRLKSWQGFKITCCDNNPVSHADINVGVPGLGQTVKLAPVHFCLSEDAERT